jgi:hypothetical protein
MRKATTVKYILTKGESGSYLVLFFLFNLTTAEIPQTTTIPSHQKG